MPFLKVHGLDVYYEDHGEGPVIVLLHHGFGCTKIWGSLLRQLVASGYRVVMYDRRGFGRSARGEDFQDFYESEERYRPESVEELRVVKELLGIGRCHLVGQCEGGVVAVDYAVAFPEEIETVTAGSTQCYSETPMTELNRARLVTKFTSLEPKLQAKMIEWHGEYGESNYDQFAKKGGAYGVGYFDLRPVLRRVGCPTLILYPDRSSIFDVEQSIAFYRSLPKGELAVFPRCGHNTYEQRPQEYFSTVLDFIVRCTKPEARSPAGMTCLA